MALNASSCFPNRCVFNNCLNSPRMSHCRSSEDNEFHRRGPTVAKHRSLNVLYERRTTLGVGACSLLPDTPCWKTRTVTLNWTGCRTHNQCSCRRIGVMRSRRRVAVTNRAVAFSTEYARRMSFSRHCSDVTQAQPDARSRSELYSGDKLFAFMNSGTWPVRAQ